MIKRALFLLSQRVSCRACPLRLDSPLFFYPFLRPTDCKNTNYFILRNKIVGLFFKLGKNHCYEVKEIELLDGTPGDDHNNPLPRTSNNSITVAKLLQISEFDNNND